MEWINNTNILTEQTSGFLAEVYSHTLNPYSGCSFAGTLCGEYCYVQHNNWITKGRKWGFYGAKESHVEAYNVQYAKWKRKRIPKPMNIFMASSTDPYIPQEQKTKITRSLLRTMIDFPPDVLWLQTRSPLVLRDIDILCELAEKTTLFVAMTVETDKPFIEGLPKHSFSPRVRLDTARQLKQQGIPTHITVAPLLPLDSIETFFADIDTSCHRVILDHYLIGDGTPHRLEAGYRTKKTALPKILAENGYQKWLELDYFYELVAYATQLMGTERVKVSKEGFNDISPITIQ